MNIEKVTAQEVKDSRGNPTLLVTVYAGGENASFAVPSGASTGEHEAHELRDADGKGVKTAIELVNNEINSILSGVEVTDQKKIDATMLSFDGTPNKSKLGGNAMIGMSAACLRLAARVSGLETFEQLRSLININQGEEVPHLFINLINGGKHARNGLAFQEYQIVTINTTPKEAVTMAIQIQDKLSLIIKRELGEGSLVLGDEGGFAPMTDDIRAPLVFLREAINELGLSGKVRLGLDVAATSFYQDGFYNLLNKKLNADEMIDLYTNLIKDFDLFSIEDPFSENDFVSFRKLKEIHPLLLIIGDDLTVTNKSLLSKAIEENSINAMIIKPNQIGTISEMLDTISLAIENNVKLVVSHRSGETMDDFIADVVEAFHAFGMKAGSPIKPERKVKYDRLIRVFQK